MYLLIWHGMNCNTIARRGGEPLPEIRPAGGKDQLLAAIEPAVQGVYNRIGIVIDADSPFASRWQTVSDYFRLVDI